MRTITADMAPRQVKEIDQGTAHIFNRYGMDSLSNSPIAGTSSQAEFMVDLLNGYIDLKGAKAEDFTSYPIDILIDFLKRSHAYYLSKRMPEIGQTIMALAKEMTANHYVVKVLCDFYLLYMEDMKAHFSYEERALFPYALQMQSALSQTDLQAKIVSLQAGYSVEEFYVQHVHAEHELDEILTFLKRCEFENRHCLPFKILVNQLQSFKDDLLLHELIEEEVLVPKLRAIESTIEKSKSYAN
jgi:regulator of cell morphogenesis and NO signaling